MGGKTAATTSSSVRVAQIRKGLVGGRAKGVGWLVGFGLVSFVCVWFVRLVKLLGLEGGGGNCLAGL